MLFFQKSEPSEANKIEKVKEVVSKWEKIREDEEKQLLRSMRVFTLNTRTVFERRMLPFIPTVGNLRKEYVKSMDIVIEEDEELSANKNQIAKLLGDFEQLVSICEDRGLSVLRRKGDFIEFKCKRDLEKQILHWFETSNSIRKTKSDKEALRKEISCAILLNAKKK